MIVILTVQPSQNHGWEGGCQDLPGPACSKFKLREKRQFCERVSC